MALIRTLPRGDDDFSGRWREIKKAFSKGLPPTERRSEVRIRRHERALWQRRFWEHAIRNENEYEVYMDYIHYNPVKHGWVERVCDWPYSTFHRLVEKGLYPEDWASGSVWKLDVGE
nr:transposase [Candidatus Thiosymbion oneisti]